MKRNAFALITVVVCLVLAALAMIIVARNSLHLATETVALRRQLQRRWAVRSAERAMLNVAPELFDELEEQHQQAEREGPAPASFAYRVKLGEFLLEIRLDDESAKFDLNTAYHFADRRAVEQSLSHLVARRPIIPVRLRPEVKSLGMPDIEEMGDPRPAAFRGWGEVFDLQRSIVDSARWSLPQLTGRVTCFAETGLNVRRASDLAIEETCGVVTSSGVARKLIDECRGAHRLPVARIVEHLGIDRRDQAALKELLVDQSSCYSVWISARRGRPRLLAAAVRRLHDDGWSNTTPFQY